jgi:hypothetical protein
MRKLAFVILLLLIPAITLAAKPKPDPADFPVTVHVISSASRYAEADKIVYYSQVLETTIEGQPIQLQFGSTSGYGVLALGDYKARKSTNVHPPKWATSADLFESYDLLMPDGNVRTFSVTRLGPASSNP